MNKKILRNNLLTKRDNILASQRKSKSIQIKKRLEELDIYQQAYTVLFYVSFGSEVKTHALIKEALKDKIVALPKVSNNHLQIKQITKFDHLKKGYKNILEPKAKQPSVELKDINLIIVPAVAFDKKHYRLGYGGGYYDRLLTRTSDTKHQTSISIGLAFEEQIIDELPIEEHDKKVNFIVTDKRIV